MRRGRSNTARRAVVDDDDDDDNVSRPQRRYSRRRRHVVDDDDDDDDDDYDYEEPVAPGKSRPRSRSTRNASAKVARKPRSRRTSAAKRDRASSASDAEKPPVTKATRVATPGRWAQVLPDVARDVRSGGVWQCTRNL